MDNKGLPREKVFSPTCNPPIRAGDGTRTHGLLLGKETFYQLNHARSVICLSAESQNRTDDTAVFSRVLYQLSYLGRSLQAAKILTAKQKIVKH